MIDTTTDTTTDTMSTANVVAEPDFLATACERHPDQRHLQLGATLQLSERLVNDLRAYACKVVRLVGIYKIPRAGASVYVFVLQFNSITPAAQDTLTKLLHKTYAVMPHIIQLAAGAQLLLVKGCHLLQCDQSQVLSDIDYVMLERRAYAPKRKRESRALPPAQRFSAQDAATVSSWQLGTLASSAQLAHAAGAAGGPARAAGVFDPTAVIDLTGDEPPPVLEARQAAVARLTSLRENEKSAEQPRVQEQEERAAVAREDERLAERQVRARREQAHQAAAREQARKNKQLLAQQQQEAQAAARAVKQARRKHLSARWKLEKEIRAYMQRNQFRREERVLDDAAAVLETMTADAGASDEDFERPD